MPDNQNSNRLSRNNRSRDEKASNNTQRKSFERQKTEIQSGYPAGYPLNPVSSKTSIRENVVNWSDVWRVVRKNIILLILIVLLCGFGYGFGKSFLDPAQYESTATIFLTPKFTQEGELDQSSISTNRTLLSNAIALMSRENIMVQAAQEVGNMTPEQIRDTLTVEPIAGTELISITSTTSDPQVSKNIVDATVSAFIETMKDNLNLDNITVVDQPKLNFESVSTPVYIYILQGAAVGLIIDEVYVFIRVVMDKRLKTKEEAERYLGVPVFVVLPDIGKR